MRDKIKFTLSALMWAVVLLAAYAVAVHAQTSPTCDHDRALQKKSGVALKQAATSLSPEAGLKGK